MEAKEPLVLTPINTHPLEEAKDRANRLEVAQMQFMGEQPA